MSALAPVAALLLSVAILVMGNGLQSTLLPVRANIESFSLLDIGILGSAYFVGFAIGCVTGSRLIHRAGHIRVFTAMAAIASAVALAHALVLQPVIWWPLRAITGFCFAVLYIVIESWLNERSTNETRGLVMSLYTAISLAVLTLGQLMITFYDPAAFPLFALASILVSLAAVPVALTAAPAPAPLQIPRLRIAYLFKLSPVGFLGCCAVGAANGSFMALGPVFAQRSGLGIGSIALFMSAMAIGGALGQWPFGRMSDKVDRRKVIATICLAACLTAIALSMLNDRWPQSILYFALLFGIFAMPLYAICVAHMNDFVSTDGFVEASSGLLLVYSAGAACGPLIATGFMEWLGKDGLFAFTAATHAAMAVFAIQRMFQRDRPSEEERSDFIAVSGAAPTVFTLDPRADQADEET
jgi:MFS family permease